jgi:hypothetical protein
MESRNSQDKKGAKREINEDKDSRDSNLTAEKLEKPNKKLCDFDKTTGRSPLWMHDVNENRFV